MLRRPIVVVGSANTDMVLRTPRLPAPGETVLGGGFVLAGGGKGANQAVAAARAGGRVAFVARVGSDVFGSQTAAALLGDRIGADFLFRDRVRPTGVALIFVAADGENCIGVAPGANAALSARDVRASAAAFQGAGWLLTQLETPLPAVSAAVDMAVRGGVRVILNPAPARPLPGTLLKRLHILTPNESEASALTGRRVSGERGAARAAAALRARGVRTVIVTLGRRGAYAAGSDYEGLVPGFRVRAVDTTAAGDVFNGALAVALSENKALPDAVRFANAAAALSTTRPGAQPSAPRRREIDRFLARS